MPAEPSDDDELALDRTVIAGATPGPWRTARVDDDLHMNALVISRDSGTGELDDHENNVAVVLLQTPRYADVGDRRWDENAEFIVRARERWPLLVERVARLSERIAALERENAALRSDPARRERAPGTRPGTGE
jgi:hypothetical protein